MIGDDPRGNPDLEMLGERKSDEMLEPYMPKDKCIVQMQKSLDDMIAAGKFPPGCRVTDVRIRALDFLVTRPDGKSREIRAVLIPESEEQDIQDGGPPQSFFAPGPGTKQ